MGDRKLSSHLANNQDPFIGLQIDKYILEKRIGRGGSGTVYQGKHIHLGRSFAIKILRSELLADQEAIDRFKREVQVLASLVHPNIVSLVDADYDEEIGPYMVMEWLDGETLFAHCKKRKEISFEEILYLFENLTDALHFMHQKGLIHRDLKPENLMLLNTGVENEDTLLNRPLKVFDFGIVFLHEESRLTAAGMVVGTPHYMAPEQIIVDSLVDHRVDIYAAGALLFEMLTGQPPFGDKKSPIEIMKEHVSSPPRKLAEVRTNKHFPPQLQEVVSKCLAKRAEKRFSSAKAFFQALKDAMNTEHSAQAIPAKSNITPKEILFDEATRQVDSLKLLQESGMSPNKQKVQVPSQTGEVDPLADTANSSRNVNPNRAQTEPIALSSMFESNPNPPMEFEDDNTRVDQELQIDMLHFQQAPKSLIVEDKTNVEEVWKQVSQPLEKAENHPSLLGRTEKDPTSNKTKRSSSTKIWKKPLFWIIAFVTLAVLLSALFLANHWFSS